MFPFPQAHLIGQNNTVYSNIVIAATFLCFCMLFCTFWLFRQKRSLQFVSFVWGGFLALVLLGSFGLVSSIHHQRLLWRDSCSRLAASYANFLTQFDYKSIQPGNPNVFSSWSTPFPLPLDQNHVDAIPTLNTEPSGSSTSNTQLSVPEGLIARWEPRDESLQSEIPLQVFRRNQWAVAALTQDNESFDRCERQIAVQWNTVPKATTYRLQWGENRDDEIQWFTAYTGAKSSCVLTVPEGKNLVLRVRAEDGTPEDDPEFNKIIDILDFPVRANKLVGYAYSLRFADPQSLYFIAAPISDANHNGLIEVQEKPNDIGEPCPMEGLFRYVAEHEERAMYVEEFTDQWGNWFTIAEPLRSPDGELIGIFAMDFDSALVYRQLSLEQIYPISLFVLAVFSYIGGILFVNHLQLKAKKIHHLANELQNAVTELTEAKQNTEKALQSKTLFLTNMSHEFRTPLNAMLGFTEILASRIRNCIANDRELCNEAVRQMKESGGQLLELIDNVLGIAAMNEDQSMVLSYAPVNLRSLITDIAEAMQSRAASKSLTLTVTQHDKIPERIESSVPHLRQVLIHLIGNAIKFTEEGGVTVRYGVVPPSPSQALPMYYISVCDTGIGIDAAYFQSIFKPFSQSDPSHTRRYGGIGIGLSVARQSAEMLNGSISVESKVGEGSTFTFTFPARLVNSTQTGDT